MQRARRTLLYGLFLILAVSVLVLLLSFAPGVRRSLWAVLRAPYRAGLGFRDQVGAYEASRERVHEMEIARILAVETVEEEKRLSRLEAVARQAETMGMGGGPARIVDLAMEEGRRRLYASMAPGRSVSAHDIALAPGGLVGRVISSSGPSCEIAPLSDPVMGAAVRVVSAPGHIPAHPPALGIVVGQERTDLLSLQYLSEEDLVLQGDWVVTSGSGAIFPPDLPVGRVVGYPHQAGVVEPVRADVRPSIHWRRLREVFLLSPPGTSVEEEIRRE